MTAPITFTSTAYPANAAISTPMTTRPSPSTPHPFRSVRQLSGSNLVLVLSGHLLVVPVRMISGDISQVQGGGGFVPEVRPVPARASGLSPDGGDAVFVWRL
ncbi:hypothetical protein [Microbacterium sp. SSM24]|uniref:hypothetical protein n=1 Tax=Microbacterium sp. SSM24 TaxID=2991714 RepID=UPI0022280475|nr:hypothetical protein [Microbacterium sp. SSM24]MCW3494327.1 hypothetical protein [Microbacterium sp. SSM24]